MKLEQIVPSLELAKELKENNFPQEDSIFYWLVDPRDGFGFIEYLPDEPSRGIYRDQYDLICAPTATELVMSMPPKYVDGVDIPTLVRTWLYLKKNNLLVKE